MIDYFISTKGNFIVNFLNFNGSGWDDRIQNIIENKLKPIQLSKRVIEQTWDFSEKEFDLEKDNIKFIIHLDDGGPIYVKLLSEITEKNKQQLRDWAMIIANEVEKLKKYVVRLSHKAAFIYNVNEHLRTYIRQTY